VICLVLAACEPGLPTRPLPELVKPAVPTAIRVPAMLFVPGETLVWNVSAKGFTLGRAEFSVEGTEVHSRFATGRLVSAFAKVRHELATVVGPSGARSSTDVLELDGETTRVQTIFSRDRYTLTGVESSGGTVPGGNPGHTLHTALGTIRAWASPTANPGFLYLVHAGDMFRIDFARPFVEDYHGVHTLRVECRVQAPDGPISVTMWLRASDDRTPIRLEISSGAVRLTAELLATDV
jgi:Protein of unknown function (DUF3108)